jgi:hypothetical protein
MKLMRCYILDFHDVIYIGDDEHALLKFADWRAKHSDACHLGLTVIGDGPDRVTVSTVFLGMDTQYPMHAPGAERTATEPPPILFETMIFGGEHHLWQRRYLTYDAAIDGHVEALGMLGTKH